MLHFCSHWRDEVDVGPYKVLVSSYHSLLGKRLKAGSSLLPSFGIYLDEDWKSVETRYPKLVIEWPDCGIIGLPALESLVQTVKEKLKAGEIIDVACYLGHGRAGTLLACLIADIENLSAEAAIAELRLRYCGYAVEYPEQVELVRLFAYGKVPDQPDLAIKGSLGIR